MEPEPTDLNIHITYCVPCGGKKAFDRMSAAIQASKESIPRAKITGEEDHRSGAFEVSINGKIVHSRLKTFMYPDVNNTVEALKSISQGGPIPNSLEKSFFDCMIYRNGLDDFVQIKAVTGVSVKHTKLSVNIKLDFVHLFNLTCRNSKIAALDQMQQELRNAHISGPEDVLQASDYGLLRVGSLGLEQVDRLSFGAALSLLKPGYITALEVEKLEEKWMRLSTGCHVIDQVMRGGFAVRGITEISGESGCGKTQLCLQLCLSVQYSKSQGGLDGGAVYICTEDTFPVKRLQQLFSTYPVRRKSWSSPKLDEPKFGENIFIEHVADAAGMRQCVLGRLPKLMAHRKIKLIVVDSVAGVFRSCYENNELRNRAEDMRSVGGQLHKIASQFNVCVICVNQVTASEGSENYVPALGLAWSNLVTVRIQLHRHDPNGVDAIPTRSLQVVFAPDLAPASISYSISDSGVFGI